MPGLLEQLVERSQAGPTPVQQRRARARQQYQLIDTQKDAALRTAPRDWIALECLGNARDYAKPDTLKRFVLWEALHTGAIRVAKASNLTTDHPWLERLFLPGRIVRFPFNTGDSSARDSLSWRSIRPALRSPSGRFWQMPRWSTASRSSVALVPRSLATLPTLGAWQEPDARTEQNIGDRNRLNLQEWTDLANAPPFNSDRFAHRVGNPGNAAQPQGVDINGDRYRLYSIKTGVHYVGLVYEGPPVENKHLLEANSEMAMLRSELIHSLRNNDETLGLQLELLTITAPMANGTYDGFQVRDLSCFDNRYYYIPGQAIPYGRRAFDGAADHRVQCDYWRRNFAVPLGRAKARLFLNYGLIHTSANAQNFVLGFGGFPSLRLKQFVLRDLGDTSWHDDYIRSYLLRFPRGNPVWQAFNRESNARIKHVLHETSSGQYPAPHLVRLATYSVLTHGFAARLGWSEALQYHFATGILDGFASYVQEAVGINLSYPAQVAPNAWTMLDFNNLGDRGGYPPGIGISDLQYRQVIDPLRRETTNTLLTRAAWVRERAANNGLNGGLRRFIGAEEALVCCALQVALDSAIPGSVQWQAYRDRLRHAFDGHWPKVVA